MELAVAGVVAGVGYYLSKGKERGDGSKPVHVPSSLAPNNKNIYDSGNRMQNLKIQEQKRSERMYEQYFHDKNTNIIMDMPGKDIDLNKTEWADADLPLEYNGELNKNQLFQAERNRLAKEGCSNIQGISLTGEPIVTNDFKHNNMIPFFGGRVKQNVDERANNALMENFTGNMYTYQEKTELKPLFTPYNKDIGNPYGMSNLNGYNKERYIKSIMRENESPVEKILVGPGLNQGYTSQPSGGFQQPDTRTYCTPKTVDDLRVKSNPKLTYEGRILSGSHTSQRGEIGRQCKRLPESYYTNENGERNFITTGEYIADPQRAKITIKDGNRKKSCQLVGVAGPNNGNKSNIRPHIRKAMRQNFCTDGPRNANMEAQWKLKGSQGHVDGGDFDYGRSGIRMKHTVRETTECKTRIANPNLNKAGMIHNKQKPRFTKKEHFVKCSRFNDRMDNTVKKSTVWDPNDVARTTMKETNIHNERTANVNLAARAENSWVKDPNDVARTTMKETNIHNSHNGNLNGGHRKGTVKDPKDKPKTTMKEVDVINRKNAGQVGNQSTGGAYKHAQYRVGETNRQTTSCEYTGNADGPEEGGYQVANPHAPVTNRQTTSCEYTGNAGNGDADMAMSYANAYASNVKSLRDECLNEWTPAMAAPNRIPGAEFVNMKTTRMGHINNAYITERGVAPTRIQQNIDQRNLGVSTQVNNRISQQENQRLDPSLLEAYRQNPYTRPLPNLSTGKRCITTQ